MKFVMFFVVAFFLVLFFEVNAFSQPDTSSDKNPQVEIILDKIVKQLGGEESLKKLSTIKQEGTIEVGTVKGKFYSLLTINPYRGFQSVIINGMKSSGGFDSKTAWGLDSNGKVSKENDVESINETEAVLKFDLHEYLTHREQYIFILDEDLIAYKVKVINKAFKEKPYGTRLIKVDKTSFLPISEEYLENGQKVTLSFQNYKLFNGLCFPTLTYKDEAANESHSIIHIESLELNQTIDLNIFSPPLSSIKDFRFLNNKDQALIPVHIYDHIFINCNINNTDYEFFLDTGAGKTVLSQELVEKLKLENLGEDNVSAVSGAQRITYVNLPSLKIGDIELVNQNVIATDLSSLRNEYPNVQGILGQDFFTRFVIKLDYLKKNIEVFDPAIFTYKGDGEVFNISDNAIPISIDGREGKFNIDTGSPTLDIFSTFANKNNMLMAKDKMPSASAIGGLGSKLLTTYYALSQEIKIGKYILKNVPLGFSEIDTGAFASESLAGNVGNIIIGRFNVYFNFGDNKVILEPNANYSLPFPTDKAGLGFEKDASRFIVKRVKSFSPAAKAGIEVGDEILEVDNKPLGEISLFDLADKFVAPVNTRYKITFQDKKGNVQKVEIILSNFLKYIDQYKQ